MSRTAFGPLVALLVLASTARAASLEVEVRGLSGAPVAEAAVFAVPATPAPDARNKAMAIEQVDREFVPHVTVLQVGTTVSFPNRDPILHHVYSFSPAKPFEIKLYSGRSPQEIVFDKAGVVVLGCNIHDWMAAYVVAVPTPYFGKSDAAGRVRLRDLPAGPYEVQAWHPQQRAAVAAQSVTVDASAERPVTFAFDLQPRKPKYKPPLDRLKY